MIKFNHFNFNVLDLDKSLAFYKEALGLEPVREKEASDGSFKLVSPGGRPDGVPAGADLAEGPGQALRPGRVRVPPGFRHRPVRRLLC